MTLRVGLTHPALTKLTFMDYLLTMLRNRLRRKHSYDKGLPPCSGSPESGSGVRGGRHTRHTPHSLHTQPSASPL